MKRSLIAGATAAGLLFGAFVTPATVAVSAEVSTAPAVDCGSTVRSEAEATKRAAACDKDVEVLGTTENGARLFAEPNGAMRLEASAFERTIESRSAVRTVLRSSGTSGYGWTGSEWVGYCDPAESASDCVAAGKQRLVWQFDGLDLLAGLEPEDITSAEFSPNSMTAWFDRVNCTPNRLDLYDIPQISADTDWASTGLWTEDRHVGGNAFYASTCEQTPRYSGDRDFDAMQVAQRAARDDRSSVTLGLAAADESCMTCGWNKFQPSASLVVRFNDRAPLTPSNLEVGSRNTGNLPCTGEAVFRTTSVYIETHIVDPDDPTGTDGSIPAMTGTFRLTRADAPDKVVWEEHAKSFASWGNRYLVYIAPETMTQGRYILSVFGTDGFGQVGPSASCEFSIDYTNPEPPVVTPVVGGQAVYLKGIGSGRGGVGVPGSFLIESPSNDIRIYRYGINSQAASWEIAPTEKTVLNFTPTRSGRNYLTVEAIDRAGNRSLPATYEFYVGSDSTATTPPAITVTGPTSFALGDVPTASVTLSKDAAVPHGTVTVKLGSTVIGSATFDERVEELQLDRSALGTGTKTLMYTYQAFPGAPVWSTERTVTVGTFVTSRPASIDGIAQVGRTLTAQRWTWTPTPTTVTYQWRLDGAAVAGATSRTWTVPASAAGKKVSVTITGSANGYATLSVRSPATDPVKVGTFSAPRPTISGTRQVGYTLQAVRGTWSPLPTTVRYQWKVGGVAVPGATYYRFRVPVSARGKQVTVVVTGSRAGYANKTVYSPLSGTIR